MFLNEALARGNRRTAHASVSESLLLFTNIITTLEMYSLKYVETKKATEYIKVDLLQKMARVLLQL